MLLWWRLWSNRREDEPERDSGYSCENRKKESERKPFNHEELKKSSVKGYYKSALPKKPPQVSVRAILNYYG